MRVADRDHELADAQALGVAELDRRQLAVLDPDHGEVGERVAAGDREAQLAAVGEPRAAAVAAADHVGGGEQEAIVGERDAAAGARLHPAAPGPARDPQAGDRGREALGDGGDGARVGVERLLLGGRGVDGDVEGRARPRSEAGAFPSTRRSAGIARQASRVALGRGSAGLGDRARALAAAGDRPRAAASGRRRSRGTRPSSPPR